jgi:hypothetical protein
MIFISFPRLSDGTTYQPAGGSSVRQRTDRENEWLLPDRLRVPHADAQEEERHYRNEQNEVRNGVAVTALGGAFSCVGMHVFRWTSSAAGSIANECTRDSPRRSNLPAPMKGALVADQSRSINLQPVQALGRLLDVVGQRLEARGGVDEVTQDQWHQGRFVELMGLS